MSYNEKVDYMNNVWFPTIKSNNIPILDIGNRSGSTGYIDFIRWNEVLYPVMKGVDIHKRPFFVIKALINKKKIFQTFFQRYTDAKYSWQSNYGSIVDTCGGMSMDTAILLKDIIDEKEPIIEEKHRPCSETYIGHKITLYDEKKIDACKIIENAWLTCRFNPKYKKCLDIQLRKYEEINS